MHIVFVTNEMEAVGSASGGLARFTANMADVFLSHGHEVHIFLVAEKRMQQRFSTVARVEQIVPDEKRKRHIDRLAYILSFGNDKKRYDITGLLTVLEQNRLLRKNIGVLNGKKKIDIVHYCNHGALALLADRSIPYVVRISSFYNMTRGASERAEFINDYNAYPLNMEEKMVNLMLRYSRAIISPGINTALIAEKIFGRRVQVLESPFVLDERDWNVTVYHDKLEGKRYLLHAGRLGYLKGTHILADIVYEILYRYPDIYVVMAGKSSVMYDEKEKKNIAAHTLVIQRAGKYRDRVIYLGSLMRNSLYPVVKHAAISFQPSRFDNLPNACIEAMALRTLVVGTYGASYEQLIRDGVSGFLGERDRPQTYLNALERALSLSEADRKEILDMAEKGIERLRPDRVYAKFMNYYNYVIKSWNRRG